MLSLALELRLLLIASLHLSTEFFHIFAEFMIQQDSLFLEILTPSPFIEVADFVVSRLIIIDELLESLLLGGH